MNPGDASYQSHAYIFSLCFLTRRRSKLFFGTKLYPDCNQQTQEIILQDFDSIFQEHGSGIRSKQWAKADITEGTDRKRSRFRLSCINATMNEPCNFHLSLLWDTHLHAWYIQLDKSGLPCGKLFHSCGCRCGPTCDTAIPTKGSSKGCDDVALPSCLESVDTSFLQSYSPYAITNKLGSAIDTSPMNEEANNLVSPTYSVAIFLNSFSPNPIISRTLIASHGSNQYGNIN
jgi:hypothetical protein